MKRLRAILLFLVLGAIVNVALAWGIQNWGEQFPPDIFDVGEEESLNSQDIAVWARNAGTHWPQQPEFVVTKRATGSHLRQLTATSGPKSDAGMNEDQIIALRKQQVLFSVDVFKRGWPARSLAMETVYEAKYATPFQKYYTGFMIAGRFLPNRFLWPGFIINTLVYGLICWTLCIVPIVMRRHFRKWRGLCFQCAYDLQGAGHESCPECGTEMTST